MTVAVIEATPHVFRTFDFHSHPLLFFALGVECSFKFLLKGDVDESIVNAPRIRDQLFKSNLTFCIVCVFTRQIHEWCVHNRLFDVNFEEKFK
jgi:hypothetical protein